MNNRKRWVHAVYGIIVLLFAGLVYAWSVLSTPIAAEFSTWTKAQLSLTFTLVMILFCIGSLVRGFLAHRLNARASIFMAAVLFLVGCLLTSRAQGLIALYFGFGICCGLGSGLSYNAVMSTMVKWFPDKSGLISGILLMGFGGSSFIIGKVYQAWTPEGIDGWRTSFWVMGVVIFIVMSICALLFKEPGADFLSSITETKAVAANTSHRECLPQEVLTKQEFWLFYLWAISTSAAGLALISQASNIVGEADNSVATGTVATIVGLISICNALGRVLFGGTYDRYGRRLSMQAVNFLYVVTSAVLILALRLHSIPLIVIGFIIGGLAYSGVTPTNSAFCRDYFGSVHYPVNFPIINTNLIFASFGGTISGLLFDKSGSYFSTFFLIIALAAVGVLCSLAISILDRKWHRQ